VVKLACQWVVVVYQVMVTPTGVVVLKQVLVKRIPVAAVILTRVVAVNRAMVIETTPAVVIQIKVRVDDQEAVMVKLASVATVTEKWQELHGPHLIAAVGCDDPSPHDC
jgi:hypothetical protein